VIASAYDKTPLGTIVDNKVSNLETPFTNIPSYIAADTRLIESYFMSGTQASTTRAVAVNQLITINFFYLVPSVGFLSLGFFAWLVAVIRDRRRRTPPVTRLAGTIWIFLAINIVTWALILFGPSYTVIHQGSYATELFAFTACVIGLWILSPLLCALLVFLQASLAVLLYGFNGPPNNVTHQFHAQMLGLTIVGLVATVGSLLYMAYRRDADPDDSPCEDSRGRALDPEEAELTANGEHGRTLISFAGANLGESSEPGFA
jgi:hypothetical protein